MSPVLHPTSIPAEVLHRNGLDGQPFQPIPAADLFQDQALKMQLNMLKHNLRYSDMIQVVRGETGTGKTSLINRLIHDEGNSLAFINLRAGNTLSFGEILQDMLQRFGHRSRRSSEASIDLLSRCLRTSRQELEVPPILILDQADQASNSALQAVLDVFTALNERVPNALRLLLVGEPDTEYRLAALKAPVIRQGKIFSTSMRPFSAQQTEAYLRHRLDRVGGELSKIFSAPTVAQIHHRSAGVAASINTIATNLLENPEHLADTPQAVTRKPGKLLPLIAGSLSLVVAATWIWFSSPDPTQHNNNKHSAIVVTPHKVDTRYPQIHQSPTTSEPVQNTSDKEMGGLSPQIPPLAVPHSPQLMEVKPLPLRDPKANNPASQTPLTNPTKRYEHHAPFASITASAPAKAAPSPTADNPPSASDQLFGAQWITARADSAHTIQLIASSDVTELRKYAAAQNLGGKAALIETRRNGVRWYLLVYGEFPDAEAARRGITKLNAQLRAIQPWVRSFGSLKRILFTHTN